MGKVNTDAKSNKGQTLLSRAAELGHEKVVKLLRKHLN
jgi:ankyrin repeat protein